MLKILDFRRKNYLEILEIQKSFFQKKQKEKLEDIFLVGEHFPVYTAGKRTKNEHIYKIPKAVPLYNIERGGSITFHGFGQLVIYPIVDLQRRKLSVKKFVYLLEEILIETCKHFGVKAFRKEGFTGVFTKDGKIGFIGLKVSRFITMHGASLNICVDKNFFSYINPCGINTPIVNICDYKEVKTEEVKEVIFDKIISKFRKNNSEVIKWQKI